MIFELAADFTVASGGDNGKCFCRASVDLDVEIHSERGRIEGGTEIGGRGREGQAEGTRPRVFLLVLIP